MVNVPGGVHNAALFRSFVLYVHVCGDMGCMRWVPYAALQSGIVDETPCLE